MGRAVIVGGTGAIGRAAARRLLAAGWSVELTGRDPARMPPDIAVAAEVDWLTAAARGGDDANLIPGPADDYFAPLLDYAAEDRWLAARAGGDRTDSTRTDSARMGGARMDRSG